MSQNKLYHCNVLSAFYIPNGASTLQQYINYCIPYVIAFITDGFCVQSIAYIAEMLWAYVTLLNLSLTCVGLSSGLCFGVTFRITFYP